MKKVVKVSIWRLDAHAMKLLFPEVQAYTTSVFRPRFWKQHPISPHKLANEAVILLSCPKHPDNTCEYYFYFTDCHLNVVRC